MSRIIISRYDDDSVQLVVGWDHPAKGAFWIEYASAEEVRRAQAEIEAAASSSVGVSQETYSIAETDVKREGGMWPGIPLESFVRAVPPEYHPLMTERVMKMLTQHAADPDSGYNTVPIDLTHE